MGSYQLSRRRPAIMKKVLRKRLERMLPQDYDIDTHFTPPYDPWDQRLCVVPSGDLFRAIQKGTATVVTDHIDHFTPKGIALKSGNELEADVVVTATGLKMKVVGGIKSTVDGREIAPNDTVAYKGMMLAGVPNFALTIGYTNASWTLKADLVADYVVRLLQEMDRRGAEIVNPVYAEDKPADEPFMDLKSGYVTRALDQLPKQGHKAPWKLHQNYILDLAILKRQKIDDGVLKFSGRAPAPSAGTERELVTA
jgi:cation diffusion facilitator CzcD-associated flavoprotein CzcO